MSADSAATNPLIAVPVLFGLSMLTAVVLFHFFKSTAIIKTTEYQLGGAIAGFVAVYMILNSSYNTISEDKKKLHFQEQLLAQMTKDLTELNAYSAERDVVGVVDPYSDHTKVVSAVPETEVPINRQFRMTARCLDPSKGRLELYVMKEGKVYPYEIQRDQDMTKVSINVPT